MTKYEKMIEQLSDHYEKRTSPLDDLYIIGICHTIQTIALNDNTITRQQYKQLYDFTDEIVKVIIKI